MESACTPIKVYGDLNIRFPYDPYPSQIVYMDRMVTALSNMQFAMLESPTGTGKTLCLICACLAWLESPLSLETRRIWQVAREIDTGINKNCENSGSNKNSVKNGNTNIKSLHPKMIYTSRTHTQLGQVMKELRKISSFYSFKAGILASRDHLCRHPDVVKLSNSTAKTATCHRMVSKKLCQYYDKVSKAIQAPVLTDSSSIIDLEDLVSIGTEYHACPYYIARNQSEQADILLIPYNYLVDPQIRDAMNLNMEGSVVIFDEAHNLESVCCEVYSHDISLSGLEKLITAFRNHDTNLKTFLIQLYEELKLLFSNMTQSTCSKPGRLFLDKIIKSTNNIEQDTTDRFKVLSNIFDEIQDTLRTWTENSQSSSIDSTSSAMQQSSMLNTIYNIFRIIIPCNQTKSLSSTKTDSYHNTSSYKMFIDSQALKIGFWCFDAGLAMNELVRLGVASILLTSGTLSPMNSLASELSLPFHIQLSNNHVLRDINEQVCMAIMTHGYDGTLLDGSFACRGVQYDRSIKRIIEMAAQVIPNGLLIFFSSYVAMQSCLKTLDMKHIGAYKQIFIENKERDSFQTLLKRYQSTASRDGAVLFAVARGKVAEGIDFSDEKARGIIVVGLPFPALLDPKVKLKREYLDDRKHIGTISGSDWYLHQAIRAVNQAIGRVIRHRDDYGAIMLCDHRYSKQEVKQNLPCWTKEVTKVISDPRDVEKQLDLFFKNRVNRPEKVTPSQTIDDSDANAVPKEKKVDSPCSYISPDKCTAWFDLARKRLDARLMSLFRSILLELEKGNTNCSKLLTLLYERVVATDVQNADLWNEFTIFLPKRYHDYWIQLLCRNNQ